jgi:16S rRNA processing protein RimM
MRRSPEWVAVGRVRKPFGLRGELSVEVFGDTPERFRPGSVVYLRDREGQRRALTVASLRVLPRKVLVAFEGFERIEDVEGWRGCLLEVRAEELPPLEEDRYYFFQLLDLLVLDHQGRPVGRVRDVREAGAQPLLVVRGQGREHLIPFVADAVAAVDLEAGTLTLTDLEGLLEL